MIATRILNSQPWRFTPGDLAYVAGWPQTSTVEIVEPLADVFPAYLARDIHGNLWRLPQIHLARHPITDR